MYVCMYDDDNDIIIREISKRSLACCWLLNVANYIHMCVSYGIWVFTEYISVILIFCWHFHLSFLLTTLSWSVLSECCGCSADSRRTPHWSQPATSHRIAYPFETCLNLWENAVCSLLRRRCFFELQLCVWKWSSIKKVCFTKI